MAQREHAPRSEAELELLLSTPDSDTIHALAAFDGDIMVLGAGGKMGPTLCRMARRALDEAGIPREGPSARKVIAVSRFSDAQAATELEEHGVVVQRADLSVPGAIAQLPLVANAIWMAGHKFGSQHDPSAAWNHNVVAAVHAAEQLAGTRIVCFSSGNVYAPTLVPNGGSRENDALTGQGDYAMSCIGRERVFDAITRRTQSPLLLFRLFYACDLRYGVATDIAQRVLRGDPVDLSATAVNVIWQGDANRLALRALALARTVSAHTKLSHEQQSDVRDDASNDVTSGFVQSRALNVTGPIVLVRELTQQLGRIGGKAWHTTGIELDSALTANTQALQTLLPFEPLPFETLLSWTMHWIAQGGRLLGKPTKFEVRDGQY